MDTNEAWHGAPRCGMADDRRGTRQGAVFVGRQGELRTLLDAVRAALDGRGSLALVTGAAGMGKTRLVVEAARSSEEAGVTVTWGHGRPEPSAPFAPWREALRPLTGSSIDDLAPDVHAGRDRLFEAITAQVERAAALAPLTVVLEDLHWADELSLLQLAWLRPRLAHLPILVIATSRHPLPLEGRPDLHLRLDGLREPEIAALVGAHSSGAQLDAADLCRRTGGNPLFVLEVARYGIDAVPGSVAGIVRQRLEPLPVHVRAVLDAASVLGESFDFEVLSGVAAATGLTGTVDAVDAALTHGFLVEEAGGRRLRFEHDLVRQAVYDIVGRRVRRALHAAAASVLDGWAAAEPAEIAGHLLAAGTEASSEELAPWAERAATRAANLCAHADAARWFDHARAALGDADPKALELLLLAADARWRAGQRAEAWAAYEEAAAAAECRGDARALTLAALGFGGGRAGFEVPPTHEAQKRLLMRALEALPRDEYALRALVLSRLSITLSFAHQSQRQRELAAQAVDEARRSGDTAALVTALAGWCDAHGAPDHLHERLRVAAEMIEAAGSIDAPELELLGLRFQIVALLGLGDRTSAERAIGRFAVLADRLRQPAISFYVPMFVATLALADGRLDEAEQRNREAAGIGARAGSENALMLTTSQRIALRLAQRRADEVEDEIRAVVEAYPEVSGPQAGLALIDAHLGRVPSARARLDRLRADEFGTFPVDADWLGALATVGEAAVLSAHRSVAAELLPLLMPYRGQFVIDGIAAAVLTTVSLLAGRLAAVAGDLQLANVLLGEAIDDCRRFGAPLLLATATWSAGQTVAGRDPRRAAELTSTAEGIVSDLALPVSPLLPIPGFDKGDSEEGTDESRTTVTPSSVPTPAGAPAAVFRLDGEVWTLRWRGEEIRVRDSKGLRYLRELLARPHREVHALDLAGGGRAPQRPDGDLGPVLDDRAKREYRQRLADLREDIDEAEAAYDVGRASVLQAELDQLVHHLAAATGLAGRDRQPGSAAERARVNVTKSIKQVIDRIEASLPALAHHLRTTVRTGTFCSYEPDPTEPPSWDLG